MSYFHFYFSHLESASVGIALVIVVINRKSLLIGDEWTEIRFVVKLQSVNKGKSG